MEDMISRQALCEYALNQKDKSITPNDIMRFPSAQPDSKEMSSTHKALDTISRQAAIRWVKTECNPYGKPTLDFESGKKVIEHLKQMPSTQPETHDKRTETHACDLIDRQTAIDAILAVTGNSSVRELYEHVQEHELSDMWSGGVNAAIDIIIAVPSAQPEWNNHTVACMLAELFDDTCACNYNGIDEWLPEKCEVIDACPNPVGVACWEQYLTHRAERRTDEAR